MLAHSETPTTPSPINYQKALIKYFIEALPFLLVRVAETGSDNFIRGTIEHLGEKELAATGLIISSQMLLLNVPQTVLFFTGVKAGLPNETVKGNILMASWLLALGLSCLTIPLAYFSGPLLKGIDQPEIAADIAHEFLRALAPGLLFNLLSTSNQQVFMGLKESKMALGVTAVTRTLASFLAHALVHGLYGFPKLGVAGAGYAYAISFALNFILSSAILLFTPKFQQYYIRQFGWSDIKKNLSELAEKGAPIGGYTLVELGTISFSTFLVGHLGIRELESMPPAIQYNSILAILTFALGMPLGIIIGREKTAKNFENIQKYARVVMLLAIGIPALALAFYFILGHEFLSPFMDISSTANDIVSLSYTLTGINLLNQICDGWRNASAAVLRGYGDTKTPMFANLATISLINVPLACLSIFLYKNLEGALASRALSTLLSALIIFVTQIIRTQLIKQGTPDASALTFAKIKICGEERRPLLDGETSSVQQTPAAQSYWSRLSEYCGTFWHCRETDSGSALTTAHKLSLSNP